jgi:predicted hydrocarbon binding protein
MDLEKGRGVFRLKNSATAQELGRPGSDTCYQMPGAVAGAFQLILDMAGSHLKVEGREVTCLSKDDPYCEYVVEAIEE